MERWVKPFLDAVASGAMLTEAASAAGVDRSTAYRRRKTDPDFAKAFEEALEASADALEREARRRAIEGWEEPVYQGGQLVGSKRVYSDTLLSLLLRGRRKKVFADRTELTGADGGPVQASVTIVSGVPSVVPPADDLV